MIDPMVARVLKLMAWLIVVLWIMLITVMGALL